MTILTYGTLLQNAMDAASRLAQSGIETTVLRLMSVADVSGELLSQMISDNHLVVILEETCSGAGIFEHTACRLRAVVQDCRVYGLDLGKRYVAHGSVQQLYQSCGLDPQSVCEFVREVIRHEN